MALLIIPLVFLQRAANCFIGHVANSLVAEMAGFDFRMCDSFLLFALLSSLSLRTLYPETLACANGQIGPVLPRLATERWLTWTGWVTTRFSAEEPLPKSIWQKWLAESSDVTCGKNGTAGKARRAAKNKT